MAMQVMQAKYLNDNMEAVFRNIKGSTTPEWRIKCTDCPGKVCTLVSPLDDRILTSTPLGLFTRAWRDIVQLRDPSQKSTT